GVLVIDPSEHDHLARRVVAEEQPVLLEEPGPKPVLVLITKGVALPIFGPRRILRDHIERQLGNCRQSLAGVLLYVPDLVFSFEGLGLLGQRFKLRQEQRVRKNRPAVNDQGRGPACAHSSSADRAASRSTSMPPTSDWSRWTRPVSTACRRSGWLAISRARNSRNRPSTGS